MNEKIIETITPLLENPELINKEVVAELFNQYKAPIYAILGVLFDCEKDLLANDDYFATQAKLRRKSFDAYVAEGFTEDQAMTLVIEQLQNFKGINTNRK